MSGFDNRLFDRFDREGVHIFVQASLSNDVHDNRGTYWTGKVAVLDIGFAEPVPPERFMDLATRRARVMFLEPGLFNAENTYGRAPVAGDYATLYDFNIVDMKIFEPDKKLLDDYKALDEMHKNGAYYATLCKFADEPRYYRYDTEKLWPHYDEVPGSKIECVISEVHSLEDAERWVLENHPDMYMGMSVCQKNVPSGDFMVLPVPSTEYPEGTYENASARLAYAKKIGREKFGIDYGDNEDIKLQKRNGSRRLPDGFEVDGDTCENSYGDLGE